MSFWSILFQDEKKEESKPHLEETPSQDGVSRPESSDKEIPGTLDLGWYYSENKDEFQMAKIKQKDRSTHLYVIGASGTGKTKFLEFLILQDIEKRNGFGVIDPHGDLIEDIKGILALYYNSADREITDSVILIDPTDPVSTVTFNPLEKLSGVSIPEQANELVGSFRRIWSDSWGVRMEDLMRSTLIALGEADLTLAELPSFLTSRDFRSQVLMDVKHPLVQEYFDRFDALTDRAQITWIEPVMNKINAFLSDDRIRQIFSSPKSSFNIREIMDHKKMLLVKLDKGKLKGSADLLGSLIMAKIQIAAFSRSDLPQSLRTPFYLYIDEFQNFATDSFAVVLSEARKYGLSLVMAHQTLSQISEELRSLILGNAGIQVYFRINRHDAQLLAKEAFAYSGYEIKTHSLRGGARFWSLGEEWERYTETLQSLHPRVCYAKHKIEGGILALQTAEVESAREILGMDEGEYSEFLKAYPFGGNHLMRREELAALSHQRQRIIKKTDQKEPIKKRGPAVMFPMPTMAKAADESSDLREMVGVASPDLQERGKSQHRYLQTLIKRMAEEKGFRAVIEQPVLDGAGRVDVSLEREGRRIACEISVTTNGEQELGNIEKCLAAGYDTVVMCSAEKKSLEKIKSLASRKLQAVHQEKVLFLQPDDFFFYLEKEAASLSGKEERVKGYRVKVQYQPVEEIEKNTRREAVGQVILQALRRMKTEN